MSIPSFDMAEKRPSINIFKLSEAYYFKHSFDDPEIFRVEPLYGKTCC